MLTGSTPSTSGSPGRVLVTGAGGFLGAYVARAFLDAGARVRCSARPGGAARLAAVVGDARAEVVEGTLERLQDCRRLVDGCSVVVHLAAGKVGHASQLFASTVTPTRVLAEAAAAAAVSRFVHVSSLAVYAAAPKAGLTVSESSPVEANPQLRDPYTFSKVVQERAVWDAARQHRLPVTVVRPGVVYGRGSSYLTPRVGLSAGSFMCVMSGRQRLPYTYVENCAHAIFKAATHPGLEGEVFNIVDDELPTARELIAHFRSQGRSVRAIWLPSAAVPLAAATYEWCCRQVPGLLPLVLTAYRARAQWTPSGYSNTKAKTQMGWRPTVCLADALRRSDAA